ncbi:MAG: hypothetical protein D3910_04985 [Candidatus Electrothrix sp. ATG2]|nr:hypothetical protein [Candidatus Electrothrix sp. ATG2]
MPFPPPPGFKIKLSSAEPSKLTPDDLKDQLEAVGLSCSQLTPEALQSYIDEVKGNIPEGAIQTYAILAPPEDLQGARSLDSIQALTEKKKVKLTAVRNSGGLISVEDAVGKLVKAATGNWEVVESTVDQGALQIIQVRDHFNWLYDNRATNGFTGIITGPKTYSQYETNEDAVKSLFQKVIIEMAAAVVKGVDEASMQATVTNIIQEQVESSQNYSTQGSRVLHLVDGYDSKGEANGIGTLTVEWTLSVANYKKKSKDGGDKHETDLTVTAWSVLYTDPDTCCKNYRSVLTEFNIDPKGAPQCLS